MQHTLVRTTRDLAPHPRLDDGNTPSGDVLPKGSLGIVVYDMGQMVQVDFLSDGIRWVSCSALAPVAINDGDLSEEELVSLTIDLWM